MRNLLFTLTGFLVGAGMIAAVAFAVPRQTTTTASPLRMGAGMGSGMMGAAASPATATATAMLTIQHVQKGCHVWSNGKTTAAMMRLHLKVGQKLSIRDLDVDAHQMLQFTGPARIRIGGPMMMNGGMTLAFSTKGVYRLGTKTVEMPGAMSVKTIGPDNNLRLVVTVA